VTETDPVDQGGLGGSTTEPERKKVTEARVAGNTKLHPPPQKELWMKAIWAAPRVAAVRASDWMGITKLSSGFGAVEEGCGGCEATFDIGAVVRVGGIQAKPELNGKVGTITKAVNESGRYGVRLEGKADSLALHGRNLSPLPPLDLTGVSIPCLRSFRDAYADLTAGLSVAQVVSGLIGPLTSTSRRSIASALSALQASDEAGQPFTAAATIFVISSDAVPFDEMLATVESYASRQEKPAEVYLWFEAFSMSVHDSPAPHSLPMLWWQGNFKAGLKQIGSACVYFEPWEDPGPFNRAWCVWQLHCVLTSDMPLDVVVPEAEEERLQQQLLTDMDVITKAWDAKAEGGWKKGAEAPTPEQKAAIERAIERSDGGSDEFVGRLISVLHRWLLGRAKLALGTMDEESRATSKLLDRVVSLLQEHNDLESAEPLCYEQVAGRRRSLGPKHADTLDAINNLALLLHHLGKLAEAEPLSKEKLAGCRSELGDRHPDTITAIDTLSQLLSDLGKLDEAMPLKRESLAVKRKVLGDRHPDTLLSVNNLVVLLNDLGRSTGNSKLLREAEPLKREALAGCREVLGNRHPHTLASIANLADMLMQLGHIDPRALDEAEPLCREALGGSREVLGEGHPDTLKAVGNLAACLVDQAHMMPPDHPASKGKLKEAEPLYREAVIGFTRGLGSTHPTTLSYVNE